MTQPKTSKNESKSIPVPSLPSEYPLTVIGTVAIDDVETPFGRKSSVFGGSASYFSYAASFFTPVSLVAVVGEDFPENYRAILDERPIDLSHLKTVSGKTFHWKGKYESDMNAAHTLDTQLNVLAEFNPEIHFKAAPEVLFLANVDPDLQHKVLDQLHKPKLKFVACDTMNFWIDNKKESLMALLPRIDCLVINDAEARSLTNEMNLIQAGQKIREWGPGHVIIKKGEHGVLAFYGSSFFALPAYPLETVKDPTGAGDSFAGGLMGYLTSCNEINIENFRKAIAFGAVTASFTVEDFGLEALRQCNFEKLKERLELFRKISTF